MCAPLCNSSCYIQLEKENVKLNEQAKEMVKINNKVSIPLMLLLWYPIFHAKYHDYIHRTKP